MANIIIQRAWANDIRKLLVKGKETGVEIVRNGLFPNKHGKPTFYHYRVIKDGVDTGVRSDYFWNAALRALEVAHNVQV